MRTATLTNLDRAEYGTVSVDLDLLDKQIAWLQSLGNFNLFAGPEQKGLLNLLGGIADLADPPEDEEDDAA